MKKFNFVLMFVLMVGMLFGVCYASEENFNNLEGSSITGNEEGFGDLDDSQIIDNYEDYEDLINNGYTKEELKDAYGQYLEEMHDYYADIERPEVYKAKVVEVKEKEDNYELDYYYGSISKKIAQTIKVEFMEGPFKGQAYEMTYDHTLDSLAKIDSPAIKKGDVVYVAVQEDTDGNIAAVAMLDVDTAVDKTVGLVILLIVFTILVLIYAGKEGIKNIVILVLFLDLAFGVMVPFMLQGYNAILLAAIISLVMVFVNAVLRVGLNRKTVISFFGAAVGILLTIVFLSCFYGGWRTTGVSNSILQIAESEIILNTNMDLVGLVSALAMIGVSMICSEVACTIARKAEEKKEERDMVKNLLEEIRTYLSEKLNIVLVLMLFQMIGTVLLLVLYKYSVADLFRSSYVITEFARAIIFGIGVILTVPVTAILGRIAFPTLEEEKEKQK